MTTYDADAHSVGDSIGPFYQQFLERLKELLPLDAICNAAEFFFEKFLILAVHLDLQTLWDICYKVHCEYVMSMARI